MLGIHKTLEPVLIEEYSDNFELIVTKIKVGNKEIRVMTGYGPQETWTDDEKIPSFIALEEEVTKANSTNKSIVIELDANSKLGRNYIEGDQKPMSANGVILSGIIERHDLIVDNGIKSKCKGVITRKKITKTGIQESTIDLVVISSDMVDNLVSIQIDEDKEKVLTSVTPTKHGVVRHESDHNSIETEFNIKWEDKNERENTEVFNFNDEDGQTKFKYMTKNNTKLSSIFETNQPVEVQTKTFIKTLNRIIHQCFKKNKIKQNKNSRMDNLFKHISHIET